MKSLNAIFVALAIMLGMPLSNSFMVYAQGAPKVLSGDDVGELQSNSVNVAANSAVPYWPWLVSQDLGNDSRPSALFSINDRSGAADKIVNTDIDYMTDIAFDLDGTLYAIDIHGSFFPSSALFAVNPLDGSSRVVDSSLGVVANSLAVDPKGKLYLATGSGELHKVSKKDGELSFVASFPAGLASSGDIAISNSGKIYISATTGDDEDSDILLELRDGHSLEIVGDIGFPEVYGLAFGPNDQLYGAAFGNVGAKSRLIKINKKTGKGTHIGSKKGKMTLGGFAPYIKRSPVKGSLRVTGKKNSDCNNHAKKWTFCQHQTGFHRAGGGIGGSDDTYAWDVNLAGNADLGKNVMPVASGKVVKYAGTAAPGGPSGAILIEHKAEGRRWWSGYLHMENISVTEGTKVKKTTVLGTISNTSSHTGLPDHLHLVIYRGENTSGELKSVDAAFFKR